MAGSKKMRLNRVLREFNISLDRAVERLKSEGYEVEARPTTRISKEEYEVLFDAFQTDKSKKVESKEVGEEKRKEQEALRMAREKELEDQRKKREATKVVKARGELEGLKKVGKIDLDAPDPTKKPETSKPAETVAAEPKKDKVKEKKVEEKKVAKKEEPKESKKPLKTESEAKKEKPKTPDVKASDKQAPKKTEAPKAEAKKEDAPKKEAEAKEKKKHSGPKTVTGVDESGQEVQIVETKYKKLGGLNFTGKTIDLDQFKRPEKKKSVKKTDASAPKGRRRRRIAKPGTSARKPGTAAAGSGQRRRGTGAAAQRRGKAAPKEEPSAEEVQKQVRDTLAKLEGRSRKGRGAARHRREKRDTHRQREQEQLELEATTKELKVTEFVTVSEVATMMDVPVTKVISACMSLGLMVTMNQRLDAETLTIVADEFGYSVEFVTADIKESVEDQAEDSPEDLKPRAPIITVMGHVDHGKTSLLDFIRKENVIAGESGGITQHIGAYGVKLKNGKKIAFLDTPGHEAFTAMRARGAQVTDLAIIVIAADDDVMPTTKEAISHSQAAGVPIVFAINKVDKPTANPENIKQKLAAMDLLVEDWGGSIQSQEISAKTGQGIEELLEKVLLEAEMLELKANPDRLASGTVVEAFLDKGRGYVSTVLVQSGTLRVGDYVLAGQHSGKVRAMTDERGKPVKEAGPSTPVSVLGLDGAPQAGDKFNVAEDEREARDIAARRMQLQREQAVRTQRHITLDEIGRRIALGDFKELNIILKGDVDGSVEALTDSFQNLSTEEIQVNIIHKGVGAITENDVLLATASDAIIIGFNVRPMGNARQIADREEIDIRTYAIIYDAINDVKDAMEGMLSPEIREEITGSAEVRETFKISKLGTVAGCVVTNGKVFRNSNVRLIREGVVIYTGELSSLKRFKDDVREVSKGYECGLQIKNYNDIKEEDIIEAFQEVSVKKKL